ncbi:hypothetical protein ACJMK2_029954 [Sinanodonta woodiana]|uniref:PHD-type domain-containing protein n=1 Tax=Sinanodonta woodiana TaxID=1069815 RepID=A0ABD3XFE7_SINWO
MPTSAWSEDESLLPSVTYPDIVNYLVFSPRTYSSEDLKSYKGLDAYNQFVLRSQRMSEKPLQPWVVAERTGRILAVHCTCMAGESETSSCNTNEELWCFCNQVESGRMICCNNDKCKLKWFHYLCLGISCAPRGKWYCPDCRKLSQFQSKRGKKPAK